MPWRKPLTNLCRPAGRRRVRIFYGPPRGYSTTSVMNRRTWQPHPQPDSLTPMRTTSSPLRAHASFASASSQRVQRIDSGVADRSSCCRVQTRPSATIGPRTRWLHVVEVLRGPHDGLTIATEADAGMPGAAGVTLQALDHLRVFSNGASRSKWVMFFSLTRVPRTNLWPASYTSG